MNFDRKTGWNLIAELDDKSTNSPVHSHTWGLDASGSMQGAGGVGGLLMVNAGSGGVHFPAYDLNGNVMGLVNATNGIISAKYEYGPFGEVFCSVGDMASVNPFQFSTKYTDNETDLVYYGYRYYSPALGRWLSRDPIEEQGGLNLYAFVNNDPVNKWDKLGLDFSTWIGNPGYHWDTPTPENNSSCFAAIKEAISMLGKLNNDKRAHCLYACKITKSCGVVMAHSLAIYKESRDFAWGVIERNVSDRLQEKIHDRWQGSTPGECIDDYEANLYGIGLAKDNMNCEKECEIRYGYE